MRILGIDPGSRITGYGCLDFVGGRLVHVESGIFKLASTSGKATVSLDKRLVLLHELLSAVIKKLSPTSMVIEKVFFAENALSALKLGQARGAAMLIGGLHGLEIVEYSPTEVKSSVVGHGRADKEQVAKMVRLLTGVQSFETTDASDALALAICHAQRVSSGFGRIGSAAGIASKRRRGSSMADALGLNEQNVQGKKRISLSKR